MLVNEYKRIEGLNFEIRSLAGQQLAVQLRGSALLIGAHFDCMLIRLRSGSCRDFGLQVGKTPSWAIYGAY